MYEVDNYTVSLLHFDDGIKDETGKVWTANGGATVNTAQAKFGGSSLYLNGSQYISTPMSEDLKLVSSDFTIDFWMYTSNSGASYGTQLFYTTVAGVYTGVALYYVGNRIYGGVSVSGNSWITATNTIVLNTWNHITFTKRGKVLNIAVNDVAGTAATINGTPIESSQKYATIGNLLAGSVDFHYTGYIDEFRIYTGPKPTNLTATAGDLQVTLSWTAVDGATGYNVKRSTNAGGAYTTIASNVSGTSYVDTSVTNGTTYYYVVTDINADGEGNNSNEASATPEGTVLLRITMNDSSEREYQVTSSEVDKFIAWCNRTVDTGTAYYIFNKVVGSQTSEEYLFFEKIISFEVFKL
ncbi:MAG: hypothetical protein H6Q70_2676 [Firmicutes bacterium]|nr:hypothetical protein [Bacillota bacterium]